MKKTLQSSIGLAFAHQRGTRKDDFTSNLTERTAVAIVATRIVRSTSARGKLCH